MPRSNDFYLPSLHVEEGGRGRHPVGGNYSKNDCVTLGTSEQGENRSQSQLVGGLESIV